MSTYAAAPHQTKCPRILWRNLRFAQGNLAGGELFRLCKESFLGQFIWCLVIRCCGYRLVEIADNNHLNIKVISRCCCWRHRVFWLTWLRTEFWLLCQRISFCGCDSGGGGGSANCICYNVGAAAGATATGATAATATAAAFQFCGVTVHPSQIFRWCISHSLYVSKRHKCHIQLWTTACQPAIPASTTCNTNSPSTDAHLHRCLWRWLSCLFAKLHPLPWSLHYLEWWFCQKPVAL